MDCFVEKKERVLSAARKDDPSSYGMLKADRPKDKPTNSIARKPSPKDLMMKPGEFFALGV